MAVCEVVRLVFSIVYCLAGIAAFVTFIVIVNYPASIWAILTAVCNTILIHLHLLKIQNKLQNWYDNAQLDCSSRFGLAFFALGSSGLVYHIVKEVLLKTPVIPVGQSEVIPAVWCFITLKSGLILIYYAKHYQTPDITESKSLVTEEEIPENVVSENNE